MPLHLTTLPQEIQAQILTHLRHADLVNLIRVSRSLQRLAEPQLWTHIELHHARWHESDRDIDLFVYPENRPRRYVEPHPDDIAMFSKIDRARYIYDHFLRGRVKDFLNVVAGGGHSASYLTGPSPRHTTLMHHVRSICMIINFDEDDRMLPESTWSLFGHFANLEVLDLTVEWSYDTAELWDTLDRHFTKVDSLPPPLTTLRKLRLRGYVPRSFARWLLQRSEHLTTLELSILDRPIGSSLCSPRPNPPPPRKCDTYPLEDLEDDGGPIPWVTDDNDSHSNSDSDSDYSHEEIIAPRALSIFSSNLKTNTSHTNQSTSPPTSTSSLPSLHTLLLTRPSESSLDRDSENNPTYTFHETHVSTSSDNTILLEWARLIRATRSTLTHLIIDQRPFCEEIELDATGDVSFLEMYPYGPGFMRFKKIVLPVLIEEEAEWPMLQKVDFYGFDVPVAVSEGKTKMRVHPRVQMRGLSEQVKERRSFLPDVERRFEGGGVKVNSYLGRRMVFSGDTGVVRMGDGLGGCIDGDDDGE